MSYMRPGGSPKPPKNPHPLQGTILSGLIPAKSKPKAKPKGLVKPPALKFAPQKPKPRPVNKHVPAKGASAPRPTVTPVAHPRAATTAKPPVRPVRRPAGRSLPPAGQAVLPAAVDSAPAVDPAQAYIDAAMAPILQQLKDQQAQDLLQEQQRRADLNQHTQQWLQYANTVPGEVQQDYSAGIAQQQALGQQALAALVGANPNAQTQADLQAINAPQSQQDQVAAQNQQVYAGGGAVLNGLALTEGQNLSRGQMAQLAWARGLPANVAYYQSQALKSLNNDAMTAQQRRDAALAEAMARVPELRLQYQSQQTAAKQKADYLNFLQGKFGVQTQQANARLGLQAKSLAVRQQQGNASLRLRAVQADRNWQATLKRLGISEANLKLRAAQAQAKLNGNGYSQSQVISFRKLAGKIAGEAYNGKPIPASQNDGVAGAMQHLGYQDALRDMLAQGIPLTIAQQALNVYWSRPGMFASFELDPDTGKPLPGSGRPRLSYQQRQAKAKAKRRK